MLYKLAVTFEFVDEILKFDCSNESYSEVFSFALFVMLYKVVLTYEILKCVC